MLQKTPFRLCNFSISFGNQEPRVWGKSREVQAPGYLKSSVKFHESGNFLGAMSDAGVDPLGFGRSEAGTAVYQHILECFLFPSADNTVTSFSANTGKSTSINDYFNVVLNWPADSPYLNTEESMKCL